MTSSNKKEKGCGVPRGRSPDSVQQEGETDRSFDFEGFYRKYAKPARVVARRRAARTLDADDVVQEAFLRALEDKAIMTAASPQSYLYRIVSNLVIDEYRKAKVRMKYCEDEANLPLLENPGDTQVRMDNHLELQQIYEHLRDLPISCRRVFSLHYIEGLNHNEISTRLGITTRSVNRYLNTIRAFVLQIMACSSLEGQVSKRKTPSEGRGIATE
jgi:RNA polymerase sigma factor (sigma-70 family)